MQEHPGTQVILFTSCKGGVGKSTVCANLAMTLAGLGQCVLLVDCDFGNRCLDLILGLSDEAVYDIGDIAMGRILPDRAVIRDRRNQNLYFIAAPYSFDHKINKSSFKSIINRFVSAGKYDFIFIDTPGGVGEPLNYSASVADIAYIIVSGTKAAIRAADRTATYLYEKGVRRQRLVVNKVTGKSVKAAKNEIISIIDSTSVKLIGAVPYDNELIEAGNEGILVDEMLSFNITRAFDNIAKRTLGYPCPLFYKIKKLKQLK